MTDIELNDDEVPLLTVYPIFQRLILSYLFKTDFNYTKTQFIIFSALASKGSLNMGQIAQYISSSNEQATRAVAPLVEAGYVERFTDPLNRTRVYIKLTELGREYTLAWRQDFHKSLDVRLHQSLSPEEYDQLKDAIRTVARLVSKVEA